MAGQNNGDMQDVNLSYVLTTYNKLPFLKEAIKRLLENVGDDEEIIVTDGGSTDGSVEYLGHLYQEGLIHKFISEPDRGEAHGFNKAILLARGKLIKILTSDDVYFYPAIHRCKTFMLHSDADVLIANHYALNVNNLSDPQIYNREGLYRRWREQKVKSFFFNGLTLMIRRSSLPFLGLFDTSFVRVDYEYALRVTYLQAKLAYFTGYMCVAILNPTSNTFKSRNQDVQLEGARANAMYEHVEPVSQWSRIKISIGKAMDTLTLKRHEYQRASTEVTDHHIREAFNFSHSLIIKQNLSKAEFLT